MNNIETIQQILTRLTLIDVLYFTGIIFFSYWLLRSSFGKTALKNSVLRRNNMPIYIPFIPIVAWLVIVAAATGTIKILLPDLQAPRQTLLDNIAFCICAVIMITAVIFIVQKTFTYRLKGFGLNPKTIFKDFPAAIINLVSIYPLIILAFVATTLVGQLIFGPEFQIQRHQQLESIMKASQLSTKILIAIVVIAAVPAFEEMVFRGLLQTMIRSKLKAPWLSIVLSSIVFATIHAHPAHWPALFVLSMCLGYSYEKSGSLFRPIFIHALFNAISVISVFYQ